jgi:hypothetical protein
MKYVKKGFVIFVSLLLVLSMLSFLIPAFVVTTPAPAAPAPAVQGTVTNVQTAPVPADGSFKVTQ